MRDATLAHYLASLEGIALARHWLVGDRDEAARRFEALAALMRASDDGPGFAFATPTLPPLDGYARWADTYDRLPNPLIAVEQAPMRARIDACAPGVALDAACGSGRHTAYLIERGHRVIGVDASPAMLAKAADAAVGADLRSGELEALPVDSESIDLVVCALALTHCAKLAPPVSELARVLRPGGRLLISDLHPIQGLLGGTALFLDGQGRPAIVQSHVHLHADYMAAFAAAGLEVVRLLEPTYGEAELPALSTALPPTSHAAIASGIVGLPGALIWELRRAAQPPSGGEVSGSDGSGGHVSASSMSGSTA